MRKTLIPVVILLALMAVSALSFPRLSLEHSVQCGQCHVNPNGSGMRNEFGNFSVALNELTLPASKKKVLEYYHSPRVTKALSVGFDSRHLIFDDGRVFRMQTDFFANLEPFQGFSYLMRFTENGITENYALISFADSKYYIKAGRFYPAFGLHNSDHKSYNNERTGHGSNVYLDGLSSGFNYRGFNLSAEIFGDNDQAVYGVHLYKTAYYSNFNFLGGLSLQLSEEINGSNLSHPHAKALFGGIGYDRFSLLGELDFVGQSNDTMIVYSNLTTRLEYGLYLIGEYNFFDGNRDLKDGVDEFVRVSLEFYPIPFFQLRPSYTYYLDGLYKDEDDFFLQLHFGY